MRKGELTRERIIAQAAPLFNQRGYAGCSMQDVMEATGLEKGGLYRHFSTKEELAGEAFLYALARAQEARFLNVDRSNGPLKELRSMVHEFVARRAEVAGGCPLMNTAIDADDGNPMLRQLARDGLKRWKAALAKLVQRGMREGEIRQDAMPQRVANTIVATLEGALMISRLEDSKTALQDAEAALEAMLDGIASRAVRPRRRATAG